MALTSRGPSRSSSRSARSFSCHSPRTLRLSRLELADSLPDPFPRPRLLLGCPELVLAVRARPPPAGRCQGRDPGSRGADRLAEEEDKLLQVLAGQLEAVHGPPQGHVLEERDHLADLVLERPGRPARRGAAPRPRSISWSRVAAWSASSIRRIDRASAPLLGVASQPPGVALVVLDRFQRSDPRLQPGELEPLREEPLGRRPGRRPSRAPGGPFAPGGPRAAARTGRAAARARGRFDPAIGRAGSARGGFARARPRASRSGLGGGSPIEPGDQDAQPLQVASQTLRRQGAAQRVEHGVGRDAPQRGPGLAEPVLDPPGQRLPAAGEPGSRSSRSPSTTSRSSASRRTRVRR